MNIFKSLINLSQKLFQNQLIFIVLKILKKNTMRFFKIYIKIQKRYNLKRKNWQNKCFLIR